MRAVRSQAGRSVAGVDDMASYLADQVSDAAHREVVGPLLDGYDSSVMERGTGRQGMRTRHWAPSPGQCVSTGVDGVDGALPTT